MSGWDEGSVTYSESIGNVDSSDFVKTKARDRFFEFIRTFREDTIFTYRDQLRRHYNLGKYILEVDLQDLSGFDEVLANELTNSPLEYMRLFEEAAKRAADQITHPRPNDAPVEDIQVLLSSDAHPMQIRDLYSAHISKLVQVPGIIINTSETKHKATTLKIQCRGCGDQKEIRIRPGFSGASLPSHCQRAQGHGGDEEQCPKDPYMVLGDKCQYVDQQTMKLQETPDNVPTGEMPRHMPLCVSRYLCDTVVPGTRVTVLGIYSVFNSGGRGGGKRGKTKDSSGTSFQTPYVQVLGIKIENKGAGRADTNFSPEEEEEMLRLSRMPDIYTRLSNSIAPAIFGSPDIKKAIACLLMGGSVKRLPDGMRLRGDINVLMLGDPGTAKSQFLKFVEKAAPIGVYTSGKGSSAAGLTASVVREAGSRDFYLEGGAMVLADGGVVCIDEFDKMREADRVAIHEAMEQQTISIAKAGITTVLNSRTSVLAAANSIFGRWDDTKEADENIDFQSTILSRFDMIFIVKDEHNEANDSRIAKHVMGIHLNAVNTQQVEGEINLPTLKKYITYCRQKCGPRLSTDAAEKLKNQYINIRKSSKQHTQDANKTRPTIPITVRQLEAIVRISESLAKMSLSPLATEEHVDEALRLFKVSTFDAALSGQLAGAEGMTTAEDMKKMSRIETSLMSRLSVGCMISYQRLVEDFVKQGYEDMLIKKVLYRCQRSGQLMKTNQGKKIIRTR
eukprot:Nk52_evm77s2367 gene=Nk52_evmTU77s2367